MGVFSLPASELSVPKRNKIDVNVVFEITNQNQIQGAKLQSRLQSRKKAKGKTRQKLVALATRLLLSLSQYSINS